MTRPYSVELRERVVDSVASGRTCRATAALFGVSVVKWAQRFRATGRARPSRCAAAAGITLCAIQAELAAGAWW